MRGGTPPSLWLERLIVYGIPGQRSEPVELFRSHHFRAVVRRGPGGKESVKMAVESDPVVDPEPGSSYGCREYSLEMQLYQLRKRLLRDDVPADERRRTEMRVAEIERLLDF